MAEQAAPPPQASAETPAASAPASTADVTTWAKAEAAKIETQALETPAPATPDSQDTPAATDAGASSDEGKEPEAEKLSRRQRDEQRREEIRTEERAKLEAEYKASRDTEEAQRVQREAEETLLTTIAKAKAGDFTAALQLAQVTEEKLLTLPKQTQREMAVYQAGRSAVLDEMAKDFEPSVKAIEGISDDDFTALSKAPTSGQFAARAVEIGRKLERASLESKIATLEAENTSLKGRLAASGPSPLHANGSNGRGALPAGSSMRDVAAQVAAEMGVTF